MPRKQPEILTAKNTGRLAPERRGRVSSGPFWLADPRVAEVVENTLLYGDAGRGLYSLRAWAIMPNHLHIVLEPLVVLPDIMRWFKGRTARVANRILGRTGTAFWQDESYDHWIRSERELDETIVYVENNPVRAGFVESPQLWGWSSARFRADDEKRSSAPQS